jgi:hypothetical protein
MTTCPNCPPGYDCENGSYYTGDALATEVKRLEDGWAWRCWLCGWHGVGLVSEEGAHRELARHDCMPDPS